MERCGARYVMVRVYNNTTRSRGCEKKPHLCLSLDNSIQLAWTKYLSR